VATLEAKYKTFHLLEIGWFIHFPIQGNTGKYPDYDVVWVDGKSESEKRLKLRNILELPEVENHYPHTVGYFKTPYGDLNSNREYLELREIRTVEEFWAFLNAVNL
jgi:hypothetical protein